jgi:EmrB/QacA subfamily drug resistance transporter
MIIMSAIMASMLFSALNQTTIGTALPRIIADLGGMNYYSWVFTAYILASSIPAVMAGRISDVYGRKPFILGGIVIFVIGSFLCGMSKSILQLIIFRAIQGVGGGVIMATTFAAVGDLFVPKERGKWQGMLGAMFGLASVFGPALGGLIVDRWHWHWVFWIFLPFGVIAFGMIWYLFPTHTNHREHKIDYAGALLLAVTLVSMLLAFSLVGKQGSWANASIFWLLGLTVLGLFGFIWVENHAKDPILPLELFGNRVFTLGNSATFLMGIGMFGALMYLPLFLQGAQGYTAMHSGLMMIPMTFSLVGASIFAGRRMSRTGKYRNLALSGMLITAIGLYWLSLSSTETNAVAMALKVILVGAGLGIGMPVFTLSIQNALPHKYLGVVTATSQLFRQIGGTVGVALMGTLLNWTVWRSMAERIHDNPRLSTLPSQAVSSFQNPKILINQESMSHAVHSLPNISKPILDQLTTGLKLSLVDGTHAVFISSAGAMLLAVILVWFLPDIPLRESMDVE